MAHGGWGNQHNYRFHSDIRWSNNDTGLCNRLLHWDYIMNSKLGFDFNILCQY